MSLYAPMLAVLAKFIRKSRALMLGMIVLWLFGLLGSVGGAPTLAALFAKASGQHQIQLGDNGEHVQVILSHAQRDTEHSTRHQHAFGSKLALLLAESETRPNGDHVLNFDRFGSVTSAESKSGSVKKPAIRIEVLPQFVTLAGWSQSKAFKQEIRDWLSGRAVPLGCLTVRLI